MNWTPLNTLEQLEEIKKESANQPVLIFKHSTTCPISSTSLNRLERSWDPEKAKNLKVYILDLFQNRPISNTIAELFGVEHQSPQVLIIKDGASVYNESHFGISFNGVTAVI